MVAEKPAEAAEAESTVEEQPTQAQAQATEGKKSPVLAIAAALIVVAGLGWFFMGGSDKGNENTGGGTQAGGKGEEKGQPVTAKKPGTGIPAAELDDVVGRRLTIDVGPERLLRREDLDD